MWRCAGVLVGDVIDSLFEEVDFTPEDAAKRVVVDELENGDIAITSSEDWHIVHKMLSEALDVAEHEMKNAT